MAMANRVDLNPWTGGGFGMFSTVDHLQTRTVRVWSSSGALIEVPDELVGPAAAVRAFPSPARLHDFADRVATRLKDTVLVELVRIDFDAQMNAFIVRRLAAQWGNAR